MTDPVKKAATAKRLKREYRAKGRCNDCAEKAMRDSRRCEWCAAVHRKRERLALKYGRPDYLAHLHEELPLWKRALLARGQRGVLAMAEREKEAS
jgi:hypothetical protein